MKIKCIKCEESHEYGSSELHWDCNGYGYDTKYVVCPVCGQINIVGYIEDKNLDVNNDKRFYIYGCKK